MRIPKFKLMDGIVILAVILFIIGGIFTVKAKAPLFYTNEDVVVFIETDYWVGSGVCISPDGIILTAAHMLEDAWNPTIRFPDGRTFVPYAIYLDTGKDIAFCRIDPDGERLPYIELGESSNLEPGDEIEIIGAPLGIGWWHSYGFISKPTFNGDIYMDIAGNPGNSGGPVLHDDKIVGILTCGFRGADGLVMGVESDYLRLSLAIYEFFTLINADEPFLDFAILTQGWLIDNTPIR